MPIDRRHPPVVAADREVDAADVVGRLLIPHPGGLGEERGLRELDLVGARVADALPLEVEGALGDFVDLPADGDGLHFEGEHDEAAGGLKNLERRIAERGARIVVRV